MAPAILAKALEEFTLATDDIAAGFELVRAAIYIRPRLSAMLDWLNMDAEAKSIANNFLSQKGDTQESILYRGLVIALSGAFEQFVRRIVRDSVMSLSQAGVDYDALDGALKKQNLYRTGIALKTIFEPPDYLALDYELLAKNLGTCVSGSKQPLLNAEAFSIFVSIVSPENLVDALKRVGVDLQQWDALGRIQALRDALERKDTRETAKALKEFLRRFGQIRNKIAHTGSSGIVVTGTDLEQFLTVFRTFSNALTSVVEAELIKLLKVKK